MANLTVARKHSESIAAIKQKVQQWLDYNFMWPPQVRINSLKYQWLGDMLQFSGTVGLTKYAFTATLAIGPDQLVVSATAPPTLFLGGKQAWDAELKKILGMPNTMPPRTLISLANTFPDMATAKAQLDGVLQKVSGGNVSWTGSRAIAFYKMTDPKTGAARKSSAYDNQTQIQIIVTISPEKIFLEVPQGGLIGRGSRATQWESNLKTWIANAPATPAAAKTAAATPGKPPGKTAAKKPAAKKPAAQQPTAKKTTTATPTATPATLTAAAQSGGGMGGIGMLAAAAAVLLLLKKKK